MLIPRDYDDQSRREKAFRMNQGFRLTARIEGRERRLRLIQEIEGMARKAEGDFTITSVGTLVFLEHEDPEVVVYSRMYLDSVCGEGTASIDGIDEVQELSVREPARRPTRKTPPPFPRGSEKNNS